MANLKEIRGRITSIGSTMQITNAMKMVSAAKLKKAQDAITQMRPYAEKLQELIQNISATLEGEVGGVYTQINESNKVLLIVMNTNRGLCGAFNSNIIKKVKALHGEKYANKEVEIIALGKKGNEAFQREKLIVIENNEEIIGKPVFADLAEITDKVMNAYVNGSYSEVHLIYNQFKNAVTQVVQHEQLLPVKMPEKVESEVSIEYLFEPSKIEIVEALIPKMIKIQVFKALLDSHASEHGARMTSMHNATDNAGTLRDDLRLTYNKARQASITNEILEIVSGAEALAG